MVLVGFDISKEKNISKAEVNFMTRLIKNYNKHSVATDGGGTRYILQTCRFLKIKHYMHFPSEKRQDRKNNDTHYISRRKLKKNFDYYCHCKKKERQPGDS
jgi:hypothetical protein